ncbi:MAG: radical SAM protein, partial [Candidatus Omnitrophota bacterium]
RFPAALLVTSRGCPGQCIFCDRSVFGNWCSFYSAGYVIGMVRELHSRYGVKEIQFRDDNFVVFKKRLVEFCRMIIAERIDIVWSCAGRVDDVDTPTLRLMKQAGCWQIWYGIESGSDEVLKADKKNSTVAQAEEAVRLTDEAGISACGFFIVGHPKETEQDIKKTIDMILRLRLDDFHISYMVPFPGSELYLRAEEFGVFRNNWKNLSGWTSRVFIPYGLTQEALEKYSKEAFFKFYMRPRIILQYLLRVAASRHVRLYFDGFLAWLEWVTKRNRYQFAR